ncbi:MAG: c-type cytochrome [Castellaniella sp.]|uniref:c-type cytochrome n=1 Tax=Castellaniella sp. TaxID=1955812 RepID=UPI002A36CA7C|nr:c-type cytochrome [Castellaniella sp.]MDY0309193.1 c-type cytochrome [Castellaniella sp.]
MDNTVIGHEQRTGQAMGRGKAIRIVLAGTLTLCAAQAQAGSGMTIDGLALAGQRQCLGCHQVDARRVGPPFRAIAERFQGRPEATEHLARVMREGSRGQWGAIPMPAQIRLPDADARRLAKWILSLQDPSPAH